MVDSNQCVLVGSLEPYSGKSGIILGLAQLLKQQGKAIAYGKPIGTVINAGDAELVEADIEDVRFEYGIRRSL